MDDDGGAELFVPAGGSIARMSLRDVVDDDLPILFEHQREPSANRMAAFPPRDADSFARHWRENVRGNPAVVVKTIVVEREVAGYVASFTRDDKRLVAYWLGSAHWGRGVATAALAELITEHERSRPLHAFVATGNSASMRVLEKCGFRRVGEPVIGDDGVEEILMRLS